MRMLLIWIALLACVNAFDTWCGKYYEPLAPRTPPHPDTYFKYSTGSEKPLLDFRCVTASSIYIVEDEVMDPPALIFDADINYEIGEPSELTDLHAHN